MVGSPLEPLPMRLTADAAVDALRAAILDGGFLPGQRLKEEEVARDLGISRTPIRKALTVLESEGLVEMLPRRGARVRAYGAAELDDMYQLRALLESHGARRAAERITPAAIAALDASCTRFERLHVKKDLKQTVEENLVFHQIILDLADSERLRDMVRTVVVIPLVYSGYSWFDQKQKARSEWHHRRILEALAAGDADAAAERMSDHTLEARDVLVPRIEALATDLQDDEDA